VIEHYWNHEKFGERWFNYQDVYKRIIESVPEGGHIVEVGAWKGASTSYLAVEAQHKKMRIDVVDTWVGSEEHKEMNEITENSLFGTFIDNMRPLINLINPIRTDSVSASKMYSDESLDAIFIDADHGYESVKADILAWMPKVKTGGILAGHDYICTHSGVIQAVDEIIQSPEIIRDCWLKIK
jgi:predicted O-methyltransferase YrrM